MKKGTYPQAFRVLAGGVAAAAVAIATSQVHGRTSTDRTMFGLITVVAALLAVFCIWFGCALALDTWRYSHRKPEEILRAEQAHYLVIGTERLLPQELAGRNGLVSIRDSEVAVRPHTPEGLEEARALALDWLRQPARGDSSLQWWTQRAEIREVVSNRRGYLVVEELLGRRPG